ncbi:TonB-dependent receptor domain-containing protein [Arenicella xantha]|uniref:Hemoglobin/transferrin/lactoferrin receptor protein n=1 Tax=Arenicella xantha TaxID=644221 RepID=A0A395JLJ9_9GAMM|nr:TonB-dependent receptor [Arenicella xantha]RBP50727.1 hemoglobin/transferrin/lactoferrin receptor protein [Arenicella xantha]
MNFNRLLIVPIGLSVGALNTSNAKAQTVLNSEASLSRNTPAEQVLVWGTQVRASSIELDEEAITIKQADHISDLLRTIPGVDVGGAHSLNQRITIRSMDDKDLRISIDGANQNSYMYHHMGNLHINADILSSVDVEVGTNSVVNGGLGGAVRFETKSAKQLLEFDNAFGGRVQLTTSDNSGASVALTGYGQLSDSLDLVVYHNSVDRDNYDVGGGEILDFSGNVIPGTDGQVRGLEGQLDDTLLKLGFDISASQRIELGYESYTDQGDYSYRPDMGLATDLAITNSLGVPLLWDTELSRDTLTMNYDVDLDSHSIKLAVFNSESELKRDETGWAQNAAFSSSAALVSGRAENVGANLLVESELESHLLTYGAEIIDYDTSYAAAYQAGGVDVAGEGAKNIALFLQDRISLSNRFALIPGIRYNSYDIDSAVINRSFSDTTLALAGEFQASDNVIFKLSATELFKGPEIGEVFTGAGLFDAENAGIEAESGVNSEFSIAFQDSMFGADSFGVGVTVFDTQLDNYIYDYATQPPSIGEGTWKDNIGDMTIQGLEAYVSYEVNNLSMLLTFSDAKSELSAFTPYADLENARLDRTQGDTVSLNLDYRLEAFNLELHWDALAVGSVASGVDLDGATSDNAKDGFTVHNISARWRPENFDGFELTVGVDNLFDEFYASQSSRTGLSFHPRFGELYLLDYEPGRNLKATLAYRF